MRPLSDVRIISLEQYGAGPFGSVHLADLGADVIKIEEPSTGGDVGRYVPPYTEGEDSLFFETFNRNKRSLSLDIRTPAGRRVFEDLVRGADAVYSNLRGDVPASLGIRYDDLKHLNPAIVCCSLTGFGMTGPRAAEPGYDYVLQGLAGWMSITGEPDGPPTKSGLSLVDFGGGFVAAIALLAALHGARRDGVGTDCDVSLYDTAVSLLTYPATWHLNAGFEPARTHHSAHPSLVPFQAFEAKDGWLVVGCAKEKFWHALVESLERPDLAADPRFATFADRQRNADALIPVLEESFRHRTVEECLAPLYAARVPCGPINDVGAALREEHTLARGLIVEAAHPRYGTVKTLASPVRVGNEPVEYRRAPARGEHFAAIVAELGYDEQTVAELRAAGAFGAGPPTTRRHRCRPRADQVTIAATLAAWAVGLRADDVPPAVTRAAGRHLLDGVGTALAAARTGASLPALTVARGLGGPPEARVLGDDTRIGAVAAAFGTGALVHALDFDDTHAGGLVHASAVVVPTVLAVGQQVGASGADTLLAAVVGYELMGRLGAASPHGFHARGLHATSVCGPLAAAAVAARLLGLDATTTTHAIGIAGSSAGGLLEFLHTGASTKQLHPGAAAAAGITAARLAAAGGTGPSSVLEGDYGLYAALSGRPADPASVVSGLGERWETLQMTVKPYPNCQLLHATLDAARALDVRATDIAAVVADVHPDAVDIVCEPRAGKLAPRSPYEAKFSLPWSLAVQLIDGEVGVDTYTAEAVARADVADLAPRVRVRVVPASGAAADAPGRVTVETLDGRTLVGTVAASSGGPSHPLTDEALVAKFARGVGDVATARRLAPLLLDLASVPTLEPVLDLCAGGTSP